MRGSLGKWIYRVQEILQISGSRLLLFRIPEFKQGDFNFVPLILITHWASS
jgi:hypothetical protein